MQWAVLRSKSSLALCLLAVAAPHLARAQSPSKEVVVVDVPAGEPWLDANRLRAEVSSELGTETVAPTDPRASRASGTLRVSIDRGAHLLVVAYEAHTEPVVRRIDLPNTTPATERAAVLLAGNLARDEAGELASELRKSKVTPPATSPPPGPEAVAQEDPRAIHDLNWLGVVLARETRASRVRGMVADILLGASLGALAASTFSTSVVAASSSNWDKAGAWYVLGGSAITAMGSVLVLPGDFAEINEYYAHDRASAHSAAAVLDEVEQAWLRSARAERHRRRTIGWVEAIGGGLLVAGSATSLAIDSQQAHGIPASPFVVAGVVGAASVAMGIHLVSSESPLESALHAYESSADRVVTPTETVFPVLAPAPSGVMVGLSGSF
jgi:hypothetical protein